MTGKNRDKSAEHNLRSWRGEGESQKKAPGGGTLSLLWEHGFWRFFLGKECGSPRHLIFQCVEGGQLAAKIL